MDPNQATMKDDDENDKKVEHKKYFIDNSLNWPLSWIDNEKHILCHPENMKMDDIKSLIKEVFIIIYMNNQDEFLFFLKCYF